MEKYFLFVCGLNLKYLLCVNDLLSLKRLDSNVDAMQDKQAGSRWAWVSLCNCSELTCIGYVDFFRSSGDVSSLGVKSGKRC